jgi:hypothetical protein
VGESISNLVSGFGMRFTGPNSFTTFQNYGTVIENVNSTNTGGGGFTALDIDCTNGAKLSNITIHGDYIAFYMDENVTLTGEVSSPSAQNQACTAPYYVTGPSSNIHITDVLSHGGHGISHNTLHGSVAGLVLSNNTLASGDSCSNNWP